MSKNVKLTVYADHTRNKISKNIFGHFMEHSADLQMQMDFEKMCWKY